MSIIVLTLGYICKQDSLVPASMQLLEETDNKTSSHPKSVVVVKKGEGSSKLTPERSL